MAATGWSEMGMQLRWPRRDVAGDSGNVRGEVSAHHSGGGTAAGMDEGAMCLIFKETR